MRIAIEPYADDVAPQTLWWDGCRIGIIEVIDRWYGSDHLYVKVKAKDGCVYILRFDETHDEWELIMFISARRQALAARTNVGESFVGFTEKQMSNGYPRASRH